MRVHVGFFYFLSEGFCNITEPYCGVIELFVKLLHQEDSNILFLILFTF